MSREIKLDGGEITVLKALGTSGSPIIGKQLREKVGEMEESEFVETISGLIMMDYVASSKVNIMKMEDVEHAFFRVNPSYARDLRDALHGRKRREEMPTRRRRRS